MKIWDSLMGLVLWPYTKVPWGMDRGVSDSEYRRYRQAYFNSFLAFFASLFVVGIVSDHWSKPFGYAAALLPFAAAIWLLYTVIRYVAHWDELQRRIMAESGAIATLGGIVLLIAYKYVEFIGLPRPQLLPVVLLFLILWFIAYPVVRKHYEA